MLLNETNNDPFYDGIFYRLYINFQGHFNWLNIQDSHILDVEYYFNHSGYKTISPLFEKLISSSENALDIISKVIKIEYQNQWNRLYSAYMDEQYNPIENYSMTENEKVGSKVTTTRDVASDTYGFNSTDSVPTNEGTETSTTLGTKDDNNRELIRSGNIGVTTSQEMLESEINLRKWNFYKHIMNDIDSIMCLQIYE